MASLREDIDDCQCTSLLVRTAIAPRTLLRRVDAALTALSAKFGVVPGTDQPYFYSDDPASPGYARKLDLLFPPAQQARQLSARFFFGMLALGARALPS